MEVFWMVLGVLLLGLATYLYITQTEFDKLRYLYLAGSMAVMLSVFRMVYRKYMDDQSQNGKNN
jgi:hypothetical protein